MNQSAPWVFDLDVLVRWFQSCRNAHPVPLGQWSNLTICFFFKDHRLEVSVFSCSKLSFYHVSQTCVLWIIPNIYVSQTCIYFESIVPHQFCWVKPANFWTPHQITKMPLAIVLLKHIDLEVAFIFYGYGGCGLYIYIPYIINCILFVCFFGLSSKKHRCSWHVLWQNRQPVCRLVDKDVENVSPEDMDGLLCGNVPCDCFFHTCLLTHTAHLQEIHQKNIKKSLFQKLTVLLWLKNEVPYLKTNPTKRLWLHGFQSPTLVINPSFGRSP